MNQTGRHSKKRKRKMVKKSRYYRERQLRILYIGIGAGILLLILILSFAIKGCSSRKSKAASSSKAENISQTGSLTVTPEPKNGSGIVNTQCCRRLYIWELTNTSIMIPA